MSTSFQSAFLLWYSPPDDDESLIGVYASGADAVAALAHLKVRSGKDSSLFEIDEYQIGKEQWVPYLNTEPRRDALKQPQVEPGSSFWCVDHG